MKRRFPFLQFHRCPPVYSLRVHWAPLFPSSHRRGGSPIFLQGRVRLTWSPITDHPILTFFDDHWEQALRYLRKKGMGKHRRGSNSESGRRLLRRLEKNHDGIRSVGTRQHYMQIYQAMKYLSLDI